MRSKVGSERRVAMALVRWEPFRELAALQNEMGRWMSQFSAGLTPGNGQSSSWLPAVDVWETDAELVLSFDLPGIPEDQIAVELDDNVLTVSAERDAAGRRERGGHQGRLHERRPRDPRAEARGAEAQADPDRIAGRDRGREHAQVTGLHPPGEGRRGRPPPRFPPPRSLGPW